MALLLNLPQQLSVLILRDWISYHKDISSIDIACSSHTLFGVLNGNGYLWKRYIRLEFLHLLRDPHFFLPNIHVSKQHVANYVAWINSRQISLTSLVLAISKLKEIASIKPLDLPTLRSLSFRDESKQQDIKLADVKTLLNGCNSLTSMDCSAWSHITDEQLGMLASHPSTKLQVLTLSDCYMLTDMGLGKILSQYRHSLQELYLDCMNITDQSLGAIAETCREVRKVSVGYCQYLTAPGLMAFLTAYPHLEIFRLEDMLPHQVSDETLQDLFKHNQELREVSLDYCKGVTIQAFPTLLSLCPAIQRLLTKDYEYTSTVKQHKEYRKLKLKGCFTRHPALLAMLQSCPVSLHAVDAKECRKLGGELLKVMVSKFGATLQSLEISPWEDVEDAVMGEVMAKCPHIQELSVDYCESLGDETLIAIADYCPKLTSLSITKCPRVTDKGVVHLLARCHKLTSLDVTACRHVTDTILEALVAHCPELKQLSVLCTSVSDHGLLKLMLEDSLALSKLFVDTKFTGRLNQQLGALGFFGSKWKKRIVFVNYFASEPGY
ncbi:hypothetical protein EON65_13175 [archaeon]|nr:MAG: hypothetical protein EON65_13175 [archaeon]